MRWVVLFTDVDGSQQILGTPGGNVFNSEAAAERAIEAAGGMNDTAQWLTMPIGSF